MLRCALRNVDPLKPDAQLSFIIHSGTDFVYRVYSCTPRVPFFDTLVRAYVRFCMHQVMVIVVLL